MDANLTAAEQAEVVREQGYLVIPDVLSCDEVNDVKALLAPHLSSRLFGRNNFEGELTERVYALVGWDPAFGEVAEHPRVLSIVDEILEPNYLLTANQAINIHPGESAQPFHNDDGFYRIDRPHDIVSVSTIWALDDFTEENGATEIVPGSHKWADEMYVDGLADDTRLADKRGADSLSFTMTMPAGSVMIYSGSLWHRGGHNRSDHCRLAIANQYCAPWLRQIENLMLSVPPEKARGLSPRVREMVGYSVLDPFMGHVSGVHPRRLIEEN